MAQTINASNVKVKSSASNTVPNDGIVKYLERVGQLPSPELIIRPLDNPKNQVTLNRFLSYSFSSSVLIPVDSFSFEFVAPDDPLPFRRKVKSGDIAVVSANGIALSTGILDTTEIEVDASSGESVQLSGRDLMSQYEDNDAISIDDKPIWANSISMKSAIHKLNENTRMSNDVIIQGMSNQTGLFATEPGESKLSALQRFLEPLNAIAWMRGDGKMIVGKPNMTRRDGKLILSKSKRESNVLSMRSTRNPTTIPNIIVPIWQGQEFVQDRVPTNQRLINTSPDCNRLMKKGHRLVKTVSVSTPRGNDAQALSDINAFTAGSSNVLQAYAKRLLARLNINELIVQAVVPGHYNDNGIPFQVDQVYDIQFDRDDIDEAMYLFQVEWRLDESGGQKSVLSFCRLGRIVADIKSNG